MAQIREIQKITTGWKCIAIIMGMAGELYLQMPGMGVIPMFDIFCYCFSLVFLAANFSRMGPHMRTALAWGAFWAIGAWISCIANGIDLHDTMKQITIVSSSWALATVAWCLLRKNARLYLFYLVGVGIGAFVGLYYFKQGVWLATEFKNEGAAITSLMLEKQIYPIYAGLIAYGFVLFTLLHKQKMSFGLVVSGFMFAGFFMLINGGSRSNFGFYVSAALIGTIVMYMPKFAKRTFKSRMVLAVGGGLGIILVFGTYALMAKSGSLGEAEQLKYQAQFTDAEDSERGLNGRGNFDVSFKQMLECPWGNGPYYGKHSVMSSAMACEGVIGLGFWIYFLWQLFWFVSKRVPYCGKYTPFIALMICNTAWAALASPFGARHTYFVLLAFIQLCRDNPNYGAGNLFNLPVRPTLPGMYYRGYMR